MAQLTLIVGGARSGKSRWAEAVAGRHARVVYVATADRQHPGTDADPEMTERIAAHRRRRAESHPDWLTVEEPWDVAGAVRRHGDADCVLVECLTLWATNLLLGAGGRDGLGDGEALRRVDGLARAGAEVPARVLVVSNEVGAGVVPANALARRFADLLGSANQKLAAAADSVYATLAGIPLRLKPRLSVCTGPEDDILA